MNFEIQGIVYDETQLAQMRQAEELAADDFREQYKQQMYAEWVREPTVADLVTVLKMYPNTLKANNQTIEGIISAAPFNGARYLDVVSKLVAKAEVKNFNLCVVCGTPLVKTAPVLGKFDSGMRCAFNRYHSVANMAAEVMTREQLIQVFGGTWLAHMIDRSMTNVFAQQGSIH
jgi:hypothetical protein